MDPTMDQAALMRGIRVVMPRVPIRAMPTPMGSPVNRKAISTAKPMPPKMTRCPVMKLPLSSQGEQATRLTRANTASRPRKARYS